MSRTEITIHRIKFNGNEFSTLDPRNFSKSRWITIRNLKLLSVVCSIHASNPRWKRGEEEGEMLPVPCMRQYHRPSFGSASNLHHPRLVISILTLTKISRILEYTFKIKFFQFENVYEFFLLAWELRIYFLACHFFSRITFSR